MKGRLIAAAVLVSGAILGCPTHTMTPAVAPIPSPEPPKDTSLCGAACRHLADLSCEEGKPVYNSDLPGPRDVPNQSCESFCEEMQDKGLFVNPRCLLTIKTCDEIEEVRSKDCSTTN